MSLSQSPENAFRELADVLSRSASAEFFRLIAERLAALLAADHVVVAEVLDGGEQARAIAVWSGGQQRDPVVYQLNGTPCAEVIGATSCCYSESVCERFPQDLMLAEMGVEAYTGVPFHAPDGRALGFIAVMHNRPWHCSAQVLEMLTIAAVQVGAELARRWAERALKESERRLDTLMSHLPGMAYQCRNDQYWTMQFVSSGCQALTGYRRNELIGNHLVSYLELIHEDDRAITFEFAEQAIAEQRSYEVNYRLKHRDGRLLEVQESGQPVFGDDGQLLRFEGFIMDVSEQAIARRTQQAVVQVSGAVAGRAGGDFFRRLTRQLASSLAADAVLVAAIEPAEKGQQLRLLAAANAERAIEPDQEFLAHSGFNGLISDTESVLEDNAGLPMPQAPGQPPHHARSLVSRRLEYVSGQALGVIMVMYRQPLAEPKLPTQVLRVISTAAANELERQRSDRRMKQLSYVDSVTGLPNRSHFIETLAERIEQARRIDQPMLLIMLDLKRFKDINDMLGHHSGDRLLHAVGRRLQQAVRDGDYLARLSGDEFVLILPDVAKVNVDLMLERFQGALEEPVSLGKHRVAVGFSAGGAHFPHDADSASDLMQRASIALHHAKLIDSPGCVFDAGMIESLHRRKQMLDRFVIALRSDQLQLHYQPQFDLITGKLSGAEALCRWHDAELGWVSPGEFIPMVEERGLIRELGDWVFCRARHQINEWQQQGWQLPGRLSVNVAAQQLEQDDLTEHFLRLLAGLEAKHIGLELTESGLVRDPERVVQLMQDLREAGFAIAIDDFGTGYSSLSYLRRFCAETLKIDMSFVRDMLTNDNDRTIVSTIVAMARSLNMNTIAEGVEEHQQGVLLRELGCAQAQGYYYGRPSDPGSFAAQWMAP